jgi:hypothetical protein
LCNRTPVRKPTRIREERKKLKAYQFENTKRLPLFPKVRSSGKIVKIFWEDGKTENWGEELTNEAADAVASEIQLELRASVYVKENISKLITELEGDLQAFDIPSEVISNALHEGYFGTLSMMIDLDEALTARKYSSVGT